MIIIINTHTNQTRMLQTKVSRHTHDRSRQTKTRQHTHIYIKQIIKRCIIEKFEEENVFVRGFTAGEFEDQTRGRDEVHKVKIGHKGWERDRASTQTIAVQIGIIF